jgi:hypothetical protein
VDYDAKFHVHFDVFDFYGRVHESGHGHDGGDVHVRGRGDDVRDL